MGKKRPLVSVVVPTYNRSRYIKACLDSVFSQEAQGKNFDIEVIVIDDGSTDNTSEVVQSYGNKVQYKRIRNSGGPAKPRNMGISMAHGDYIAFLDADDMWLEGKIKWQLGLMEDNRLLALSSTNAEFIDSEGHSLNRLVVEKKYVPEEFTFESLLEVNFMCTSGVMVRSSVFDSVDGFNETQPLNRIEDYELWLRIAVNHRVGFINKPLVRYRDHDTKISTADGRESEVRLVHAYKSLLGGQPLASGQQKLVAIKLAEHYRVLASFPGTFSSLKAWFFSRYFALKAKLLYN